MEPNFVLAGALRREYLLFADGSARTDAPGGEALYAAGGLAVWASGLGLAARVGEDFPREWLAVLAARGVDVRGVRIVPEAVDLRSFAAYDERQVAHRANPVSHYARRGLAFPKSLLGYLPPSERRVDPDLPGPDAPRAADLPEEYLRARAAHIAPLDLLSQSQLLAAFRQGGARALSLEPLAEAMQPDRFGQIRELVRGLTAFLPSLEDLRALFWGRSHDPWEMAVQLAGFGCAFVVIKGGPSGQMVYDSQARRRWIVPAYPARVFDPTGAGAAFCGGFVAGLLDSGDPREAALRGNVSASLKMEGIGPFYPLDVLPGLAEARLRSLRDMVREA
jgi:ribokinase